MWHTVSSKGPSLRKGCAMKSAISMLLFTAISATAVLAQRSTQLTGRISDPTDAVVEGADVIVTNQDTGIRRVTKSNELGYFVVPLLQPGRYEVTVRKSGFRTIRRSGITLEVDQAGRVDFVMEVGSLTESVQVNANVAAVDTHSATLKEVVDERRIRELPLNGRDATQLVLLLPGVYGTTRDNSGLRQAGSGRGIVQAGVASNGARGNMVNYMLDGTTHNDTYTNVALAFPNPDALQEFSVQTNKLQRGVGPRRLELWLPRSPNQVPIPSTAPCSSSRTALSGLNQCVTPHARAPGISGTNTR